MMNRLFPSSRRAAFTLVELLTVIAIIGILAAIIIPVVGQVRAAARGASCVSNLRQLGTAVHLFAADTRGRFPEKVGGEASDPGGTFGAGKQWDRALFPYLGIPANANVLAPSPGFDVFYCPASEPDAFGRASRSYWFNDALATGAHDPRERFLNGVANPARTLMLTEVGRSGETHVSFFLGGGSNNLTYFRMNSAGDYRLLPYIRHRGKIGVVTVDGAAALVGPAGSPEGTTSEDLMPLGLTLSNTRAISVAR